MFTQALITGGSVSTWKGGPSWLSHSSLVSCQNKDLKQCCIINLLGETMFLGLRGYNQDASQGLKGLKMTRPARFPWVQDTYTRLNENPVSGLRSLRLRLWGGIMHVANAHVHNSNLTGSWLGLSVFKSNVFIL